MKNKPQTPEALIKQKKAALASMIAEAATQYQAEQAKQGVVVSDIEAINYIAKTCNVPDNL